MADRPEIAGDHRAHGGGEHHTGGSHHRTGHTHATDESRFQAGPDLLLDPGYQHQVVIGPHRQEHDQREFCCYPVQLEITKVLPDQRREPEGGPQRHHDGADDDAGRDQSTGDDHHDDEDEHDRGHPGDHQVILGAVGDVVKRRSRTA